MKLCMQLSVNLTIRSTFHSSAKLACETHAGDCRDSDTKLQERRSVTFQQQTISLSSQTFRLLPERRRRGKYVWLNGSGLRLFLNSSKDGTASLSSPLLA